MIFYFQRCLDVGLYQIKSCFLWRSLVNKQFVKLRDVPLKSLRKQIVGGMNE